MDLNIFKKKEDSAVKEEVSEEKVPEGKYEEPCSLCGKSPCDKKWGGQFFHKKCFRKIKKGARGML